MQTGAGDSGSRRRSEGGEEGRGTEGRGKGEERQGRETEGRETGKRDRGKREEGQRGETSSSFRTLCSAVLATECLCSVQSFLNMGRSATPVLKRPAGKACAPSRTSQRSLASRRRKRSKGHGSRSRSPSPKRSRGHGSQKSSLKPAATSGGACHKPRLYKTKGKSGCRAYLGRRYVGFFSSMQAAHEALDKSKPIEKAKVVEKVAEPKMYKYVLTRQTQKGPTYQGAIWTKTKVGKQMRWAKKFFPRAKSPKAAAELVAEYLETTLRSIKVGKSSREPPAQSADRMALLCEVFRGWVPADLENAVSFRGRASCLQACGPAAYVAGLVGKEDRWRDAVLEIWEAMPSSERVRLHTMGSRDRTLALDGARALHAFLSLVVVRWAGWSIPRLGSMSWPVDIQKEIAPPTPRQQAVVEEDRRWWKHNVHRNVVFHFSPGPLAQQLGLIRKTARRAGSLLIGTDEGQYYCLAAFDAAKAEGLLSLHAMGVLLNSLPIPRNNREWAGVQADANRMADTLRIKRPEYRGPWLVRTYFFAEMRHHGVKNLRIVEDWTLTQLQEAIQPEQNKFLTMWMTHLAEDSLKQLLRRIRFAESLEMLSIYSCVLNDSTLMSFGIEEMQERKGEMRKARREMRSSGGYEMSPALVVSSVLSGHRLQGTG